MTAGNALAALVLFGLAAWCWRNDLKEAAPWWAAAGAISLLAGTIG